MAAGDSQANPAGRHVTGGIVCGSTECPTCGRTTTALIGPCDGCDESYRRTGKFLRRPPAARQDPP